MTKIAIPPDLAGMFTACEDAYEQSTREGYAEKPAVIAAVTAFHILIHPVDAPDIELLGQYFYGYAVSWEGAVIGLFWGFVSGFVMGWFVAFIRNFVVATTIFTLRAKAELSRTADFLDHI